MILSEPFFSVIMPVHNAARYIEKAIQSILTQTYTNFELIIVDDKSTDNSLQICNSFAQQDKRVIVKSTKENIGVSNARNEGLKWIRGKYITFVDSDDWIDNSIFEEAYTSIQTYNFPSVIKYGCIEEYFDIHNELLGTKQVSFSSNHMFNNANDIRKYIIEMEQMPLFGYVCNGFYKSSIIKSHALSFSTDLKVNEDFFFNLCYFSYVDTMICLKQTAYHYAKRVNNSLSTKKNNEYYKFHMFKIEQLFRYYTDWNLLLPDIQDKIYWLYTRYIYSTICREKENDRVIKEIYQSQRFKDFQNHIFLNMPIKQKVLIGILKSENKISLHTICMVIMFVQRYCRVFFAKIKE